MEGSIRVSGLDGVQLEQLKQEASITNDEFSVEEVHDDEAGDAGLIIIVFAGVTIWRLTTWIIKNNIPVKVAAKAEAPGGFAVSFEVCADPSKATPPDQIRAEVEKYAPS